MIMVLSLPSTCNQLKKNVIFYQKFHKNYITDNILSRKSVQTLVWLSNWTLSAFRVLFTPIFVICYKFSPTCFSEKEINCWLCSQYRKWFFYIRSNLCQQRPFFSTQAEMYLHKPQSTVFIMHKGHYSRSLTWIFLCNYCPCDNHVNFSHNTWRQKQKAWTLIV